jgi:hypothetical protein
MRASVVTVAVRILRLKSSRMGLQLYSCEKKLKGLRETGTYVFGNTLYNNIRDSLHRIRASGDPFSCRAIWPPFKAMFTYPPGPNFR